MAKYSADRVICEQFNLSWLDLQQLTYVERICLLAIALDADELADYKWWVNSGQDPKKFVWSSPDKAGTEPVVPLEELVKQFQGFAGGVEKAKEVAFHLGRPLIYITQARTFEDEFFNPIEMTEELMNKAIVVRKPDG